MAGDNNTLYEQVLGAEQSVIGSMLIDPKTVGLVVAELSEDDFSLEITRTLFRAFRKLYLGNRIMDPVTVLAAIGPQDASMRSYVMELMDRTLTPANIVEYIEQVKRESLRLRLQNIGRELLERLSNPEDAMPLLMRGMELLSGQRQDDEADMERSILDFYEDLKHEPEYLPWGFPELDEGLYDAIILAAAGLERLGHGDRISSLIPADVCLPAVGQGALAIEARTADKEVRDMLSFLNDLNTKQATDAERAFLGLLEGGCQVPIGVHADVEGENIRIEAIIAALDGSTILRDTINGKADDAVSLGQQLGKKMLAAGGQEILASIL